MSVTERIDARREYEAWHGRLEVDGVRESPWHRLLKEHLNHARDCGGKRVLEIACGRGGLACWLAAQPDPPYRVVAADFAAAAVWKGKNHATQRGLTMIRWEVSDIQAIPHPDGCFDTVISCETIEHVRSPRSAIREMARVLKAGGRLLLTTPNYLGTLGLYRIYLRMRGRPYTETGQPINHCTLLPRTRAWVAAAGLRVTRVDAIGHYLPFPGRPPIELPALDRPRRLMRWLGLHSLIVAEKPN
jgi:SAM-dependent methyltransferase